MMKRISLICLALCTTLSMSAQQKIQLHHINTKGNVVKAVYADTDGIIWLGTTSGLFSLPQLSSRNPSAYQRPFTDINNNFNMISGDNEGRLWIKNVSNDMYRYDPRHNKFIEDTKSLLASQGINIWKEYTVNADEEGNVWVMKDNRLYWLEAKTGHVSTFNASDGDRILSFARNEQLAAYRTKKQLCFISLKDKKLMRRVSLPEEFHDRRTLMMDESGKVCVWANNAIRQYDIKAGQWSAAVTLPSHITGAVRDNRDYTWVSTQTTGVFIYDAEGNETAHLQREAWSANSLQSDQVDMIYYERQSKTVWLAYAKGGLTVCSTVQDSYAMENIIDVAHQDAVTDVLTFAPTYDGQSMWVGLEKRGVYQVGQTASHIINQGNTTALYPASDGTMWAGFFLGGLHQTGANGTPRHEVFKGKSPYAVVEDDSGKLYVALLGEGVWWLDPETGDTANTHLKAKFVFDLKYRNHCVYAATTEGLYRNSGAAVWEKVCEGNFRNVLIDRYDNIWLLGIEGREGLTLLDASCHPTGLLPELKSAPLKSIAADGEGNVWITTPTELLMLQADSESEKKYKLFRFNINPAGRQVFYNYRAAEMTADGTLWLGTTNGYQRIDTRKLIKQTMAVAAVKPLVIGSISINDNILSPSQSLNGRQVLKEDIVFTREISLHYDENNLVIECLQPYDDTFTTDTYFYQLKGLSDTWYPMKDMTIVLPNLPPGDYELFTRTQSSRQSLLITIHIARPLWLTWWAWLFYLTAAAVIGYFLTRYYLNKRAYKAEVRQLQLQQQQQELLNEMKLRFFTNISHDLRTPLSLIIGPTEELLKNPSPANLKSSLDMIHRNAENLLSLVNQILDFRRLESGGEKLQLTYGDTVRLLRDICDSFRLKAEKDQIDFTFDSTLEHVETMFDRDKTTKIMMNLLSNAFKFTGTGGSVSVNLDVTSGQIAISVADSGIGIPDEEKPHIFERFYQSDTSGRTSSGSGIGLHIVREYVHLQGGKITVENPAEGSGSVFRFTIPLRKNGSAPKNALMADTTDKAADSGTPVQQGTTTLLIVDDNKDLLTYMSQSLANEYSILTATNGQEALDALGTNDIGIIVSDVVMPGIDGLELCRKVKTDIETSHIPVVLLTANTMTSDELQGLEAGADDYITKPFSMDILRQRISRLVERSRNQHERFAREMEIEPSEITVTSLDEQFITRAIKTVEEHISEPDYSVEQLSSEMGVHRAQLYKKLYHLTGKTPQQFIRVLRLKRGRQLLEQSGLYISEVAYKVGFNSPRIFSKYFKEEFGITPKEFSKGED